MSHRKQKKTKPQSSPNLYVLEIYNQRLFYEMVERIKNGDVSLDELQHLILHYTGMYSNHKELIRNILFIFQSGIDPLTGLPLTDFNYHHIVKDEYGGAYDIKNGILLNKPSHEHLHNEIELYDKPLFNLLTDCLLLYKDVLQLHNQKLLEQWNNEVSHEYQKSLKLVKHR